MLGCGSSSRSHRRSATCTAAHLAPDAHPRVGVAAARRMVRADGAGTTWWEPLISDFSLAAGRAPTAPEPWPPTPGSVRCRSLAPARWRSCSAIPAMETYLAPEAFTDSDPDGVALDAFSIGALTYLLFTGQPPASDRCEMRAALGSSGLSVSAVMPEIDPRIEALVRRCTTPIVSDRHQLHCGDPRSGGARAR